MSLRSRTNYVAKQLGITPMQVKWRIEQLGRDSADLAHSAGITLKEADLLLIQERFHVICAICKADHGIGQTATQGSDCASVVLEHEGKYGILCCYGSHLDTDFYDFVKDPPAEYLAKDDKGRLPDPVCDVCIKQLLDGGWLSQRAGEYPWGPPWRL